MKHIKSQNEFLNENIFNIFNIFDDEITKEITKVFDKLKIGYKKVEKKDNIQQYRSNPKNGFEFLFSYDDSLKRFNISTSYYGTTYKKGYTIDLEKYISDILLTKPKISHKFSTTKVKNESVVTKMILNYPTMEDVEKANHEQICRWYRFLDSPGSCFNNLSNDEFREYEEEIKKFTDIQVNIMNRISEKFKEGGGFNSELSKKIGWNK